MSLYFEEDYYHTFTYELGPLAGWSLATSNTGATLEKRQEEEEWVIEEDGRGRYYLKVARGSYKNYYLTAQLHQKNKNVCYAKLTPNKTLESLWILDLTQKFNYDKSKRIIKNWQTQFYLRVAKEGRWKNGYGFSAHLTKAASGLQDGVWRIQSTTQTDEAIAKIETLENNVSEFQRQIQQLLNKRNKFEADWKNIQAQLKTFNSNCATKITKLDESIKRVVEQNAQLQNQVLMSKKYAQQIQQKQKQLQVCNQEELFIDNTFTELQEEYENLKRQILNEFQTKKSMIAEFNELFEAKKSKFGKRLYIYDITQSVCQIIDRNRKILDQNIKFNSNKFTELNDKTNQLLIQMQDRSEKIKGQAQVRNKIEDLDERVAELTFLRNQIKKQCQFEQKRQLSINQKNAQSMENFNIKNYNNLRNIFLLESQIKFYEQQITKLAWKYQYFKNIYVQQKKPKIELFFKKIFNTNTKLEKLKERCSQLRRVLKQSGYQIEQKHQKQNSLNQPSENPFQKMFGNIILPKFQQKIPTYANETEQFKNIGLNESEQSQLFNIRKRVYNKMMRTNMQNLFQMDDLEIDFEAYYQKKQKKQKLAGRQQKNKNPTYLLDLIKKVDDYFTQNNMDREGIYGYKYMFSYLAGSYPPYGPKEQPQNHFENSYSNYNFYSQQNQI